MNLALFALPIEGEYNGLPTLIMGLTPMGEVLTVQDDGTFVVVPMDTIVVNWRYDWTSHRWVETGDIHDEEVDPSDGGSDVPGSVPDPDDDGPRDAFDEEGQSAPGDPGALDTGEAR